MSGQLLELVLKQAVLNAGGNRRFATEPLGPVLKEAGRLGLFKPPSSGALTVANSRFAAKELRNIASHGSPWQDDDTEQRATYSIIYLVCFSGYLFPRTDPGEAIDEVIPYFDENENSLEDVEQVFIDTNALNGVGDDELQARVREASPRSFLRLARAAGADKRTLASVLSENFGYVIENAGYGRVRSLLELAQWCQDNDMPAHARSCGILLPHDSEALERLGRASPLNFAKYLYECRRAEPRLFDRSFNQSGVDPVLKVVHGWLHNPDVNATTAASLLSSLPKASVRRFLNDNRNQVVQRIEVSTAASGVAWLKLLRYCWPCEAQTERDITAGLQRALAEDDDPIVGAIPLRLSQLGVLEHDLAVPIVDELLDRAKNGMKHRDAQRVLWDLFALSQRHAQPASELATQMFEQVRKVADPWTIMLWASIVSASGHHDQVGDLSTLHVEWPNGNIDLVQQLRVGYIISCCDAPISSSRTQHLSELAHQFETRPEPSNLNTAKFIAACRVAFPKHSEA